MDIAVSVIRPEIALGPAVKVTTTAAERPGSTTIGVLDEIEQAVVSAAGVHERTRW
jgi:hypothetical protein